MLLDNGPVSGRLFRGFVTMGELPSVYRQLCATSWAGQKRTDRDMDGRVNGRQAWVIESTIAVTSRTGIFEKAIMKHKLLTLLPIPMLLSGLTACTTVHEHDYPPRDRVPYYEPRPVYSDYDYYFYPNVAVYVQISTGFYFYEDHGRWIRVRQLPPHIHLDNRYRRQLIIRDPYPYVRYTEHARQYGGRVVDMNSDRDRERDRDRDNDRRDDGRIERDLRPMPPNGDRRDREPERNFWQEREERRAPPMDNRGQERREQVVPERARDDDRRDPRAQGNPREDDKNRGYDRDRAPDARPDVRRPSQDDAQFQRTRGSDERGSSREAGPVGKPDGSSRRDAAKPDDKGGKGRGSGSKDDEEDRDRGAPSSR